MCVAWSLVWAKPPAWCWILVVDPVRYMGCCCTVLHAARPLVAWFACAWLALHCSCQEVRALLCLCETLWHLCCRLLSRAACQQTARPLWATCRPSSWSPAAAAQVGVPCLADGVYVCLVPGQLAPPAAVHHSSHHCCFNLPSTTDCPPPSLSHLLATHAPPSLHAAGTTFAARALLPRPVPSSTPTFTPPYALQARRRH